MRNISLIILGICVGVLATLAVQRYTDSKLSDNSQVIHTKSEKSVKTEQPGRGSKSKELTNIPELIIPELEKPKKTEQQQVDQVPKIFYTVVSDDSLRKLISLRSSYDLYGDGVYVSRSKGFFWFQAKINGVYISRTVSYIHNNDLICCHANCETGSISVENPVGQFVFSDKASYCFLPIYPKI